MEISLSNDIRMKKKLLITGISGLLGSNLALFFKDRFQVYGIYSSNPVELEGVTIHCCNLTSEDCTQKIFSDIDPDIVIHCASRTNVDLCELNKEDTYNVNVNLTQYVQQSISNDTKLIYISSDSVYKGESQLSAENSQVSPQNYYGQTKLEGESKALNHPKSLVLRTNIFGWNIQNKKSLGEWILGELRDQKRVNGFSDVYFSTIYTFELAKIIDLAIRKDLNGVYNCGATNSCTKYQFASLLASKFGYRTSLVNSMSIDKFSFQAKRGKKLSLNVKKIEEALSLKMPTIEHSLECFYRDYHSALPEHLKTVFLSDRRRTGSIPYGRQWIDNADIEAVSEVLKSDWITQGPKVNEFEEALCRHTTANHAVAVNSGTSALHVACLAAGIKQGDEVVTSPITFVASANCVLYCGAVPVFADVDPETYNLDPKELERKITKRTKAVIPVHLAGQSCDMQAIKKVVESAEDRFGHKIWIIEDASHALGSKYFGYEVGSCVFSDMSVLSFHPVKHITTGEGGAVLTNQEKMDERLRLFRSHGITKDLSKMHQNLGNWYYEQHELGYNYRITDIQSVLGLSQIKRLALFKDRRRNIVNRYNEALRNLQHIKIPYESQECDSNFHLYVLLVDFGPLGLSKNDFMARLKEMGVLSQVHYIPVYRQPYYKSRFNLDSKAFPAAELYFQQCVSLPLFPAMMEHEEEIVIESIKKLINEQT